MIPPHKSTTSPLHLLGYGFLFYITAESLLLFIDYLGNDDSSTLGVQNQELLFYLKTGIIIFFLLILFKKNPKRNTQNLVLSLVSITIMLFIVEIVCRLVLTIKHSKEVVEVTNVNSGQENCVQSGPDYTNVYNTNPNLGIIPKPSNVFNWIKKCGADHYIFNVRFATDKYSRRITPDSPKGASKYALFFGCSFTFGDGLNDNQTLPYFFQSLNQQYKSYNYAFNSYTTTHMLAHLNRTSFSQEIQEKEGVAFYIFYTGHLERNIPSLSWGRSWDGNYLVYDKNSLEKTGIIKQKEPIKYWLFNKANNLAFLKLFQINYPLRITKENLAKTADIIEDAYRVYTEKFANKNFIVLVYPGSQLPTLVKQRLHNLQIRILNYEDLFTLKQSEFWIKGDGHPNEKANRRVAQEIIADLKVSSNLY
ncbi:hypothetical protein [Runella salmonicolor]|uniref:SGNH/GDSL hydrolase family protein n=1 Tax=Runella salmonicolor TaxID=2950278 RepID=A0ABT1FSP6_9BACT|nr:hypothetical protein [Runella salmonicolor]MCP1384784.1 hypothetical protein [Runella salmonicolor]